MATGDAGDDGKKKNFFSQVLDTFQTVPCTRNAYLHGFSSGLFVGVATFLFTSSARRANNFGVLAFAVTMPGSLYQLAQKEEGQTQQAAPTYASWKPDDEQSSDKTSR